MFDSCLRWCLPAAVCIVALSAAAAQPTPPARPDPLDPAAEVPRTVYRSPLPAGRPRVDRPVGGWREANDTVARIGGWRAYAREAAAPPPSDAASAAGDAASTPIGHAGHRAQ